MVGSEWLHPHAQWFLGAVGWGDSVHFHMASHSSNFQGSKSKCHVCRSPLSQRSHRVKLTVRWEGNTQDIDPKNHESLGAIDVTIYFIISKDPISLEEKWEGGGRLE